MLKKVKIVESLNLKQIEDVLFFMRIQGEWWAEQGTIKLDAWWQIIEDVNL